MKRKHADVDLYEQVLEAPELSSTSDAEDEQPDASSSAETEKQETKKVIDLKELAKQKQKVDQTGIVYISRIPPGMGPSKLKHLMSQYGETGRVYLARDPKDVTSLKKRKNKHLSYRFVEGWIEFMDKRVARHTAQLLNAKPIGGKPSSAFFDDIWTLKYLPKFKWNMLSAAVAQQQALERAKLRNEISQAKKSQATYLNQVERARVQKKIEEKRTQASGDSAATEPTQAPSQEGKTEPKPKKQRPFKQRKTIREEQSEGNTQTNESLQGVLDTLFG